MITIPELGGARSDRLMHGVLSFAGIVALCVAAAVVYGIAHDLVTAHLCVEYFTIGHPRLIESESPVALALFWGWFATWWLGAGLGLLLAIAARAGSRAKRRWRDLVGTVVLVLFAMAAAALVAGLVGRFLAGRGAVWLVGDLAERVPRDRHVDFLTALWAHVASYVAGALGGIVDTSGAYLGCPGRRTVKIDSWNRVSFALISKLRCALTSRAATVKERVIRCAIISVL